MNNRDLYRTLRRMQADITNLQRRVVRSQPGSGSVTQQQITVSSEELFLLFSPSSAGQVVSQGGDIQFTSQGSWVGSTTLTRDVDLKTFTFDDEYQYYLEATASFDDPAGTVNSVTMAFVDDTGLVKGVPSRHWLHPQTPADGDAYGSTSKIRAILVADSLDPALEITVRLTNIDGGSSVTVLYPSLYVRSSKR